MKKLATPKQPIPKKKEPLAGGASLKFKHEPSHGMSIPDEGQSFVAKHLVDWPKKTAMPCFASSTAIPARKKMPLVDLSESAR